LRDFSITMVTSESRRRNVPSVGWDVAPVDDLDSIRFADVIIELIQIDCELRHVLFDIRRNDVILDHGGSVVDFDDRCLGLVNKTARAVSHAHVGIHPDVFEQLVDADVIADLERYLVRRRPVLIRCLNHIGYLGTSGEHPIATWHHRPRRHSTASV